MEQIFANHDSIFRDETTDGEGGGFAACTARGGVEGTSGDVGGNRGRCWFVAMARGSGDMGGEGRCTGLTSCRDAESVA
eukprot:CAMPEP_0175810466 /NCGR_PEP_ID=MMETSP0107_2-20121207/3338_1 /TAXON_ID=195067 ORGANISM="Goniomonas pacifica, Strain CCMP1869" /NCGR_SAMPLE_ID=MMETSP0107_2 /ASSEMBLY_ACC=CAM_ASM_000203 /LENGTH=78 /DNA_ID=CAMNT_0017122223 /DNA_START=219 /DNA_END=456 /DNA_ORIENTATION=+